MRYSLNPELATILKKSWDEIGLSEEVQDNLLELMDIAAISVLQKESRRIARCLVDEGLSSEQIKRITGCSVDELYPSTVFH